MSGEKWPVWLFEYDYEGETFIFEIPARDSVEAQDRVKKLALYSRLSGELMGTVPVPRLIGHPAEWFVRLLCWWKNL